MKNLLIAIATLLFPLIGSAESTSLMDTKAFVDGLRLIESKSIEEMTVDERFAYLRSVSYLQGCMDGIRFIPIIAGKSAALRIPDGTTKSEVFAQVAKYLSDKPGAYDLPVAISTSLALIACYPDDAEIKSIVERSIQSVLDRKKAPASPDTNFSKVPLPKGIQCEIPNNWWLFGSDLNATIKTSAEALQKNLSLDIPDGDSKTILRANSMPRSTFAGIAIGIGDSSMSPDIYKSISDAELKDMEKSVSEIASKGLKAQGDSLLTPCVVKKVTINELPVISTTYVKSGKHGPVNVEILDFTVENKSLQFTLSYRESESLIWKPVIEYMRNSIKRK